MTMKIFFLAIVAVVMLGSHGFASEWITEEPNNHRNQVETELHAVFGAGDLGAGVRIGVPVLNQGFISSINNNVALNFGADLLYWSAADYAVTGVVIPVMLQWNFYLTRDWSVFAEGGVAFQDWFSQRANGEEQTFFVWPGMGAGVRYYFNPGNYPALIVRFGYPSGLAIGVSF